MLVAEPEGRKKNSGELDDCASRIRLTAKREHELDAAVASLVHSGKPVHVATEDTDLTAELKRGLSFIRQEKPSQRPRRRSIPRTTRHHFQLFLVNSRCSCGACGRRNRYLLGTGAFEYQLLYWNFGLRN
jgi:hypothetical protein